MPSRLDAYRSLIDRALEAGYKLTSVGGFWANRTSSTASGSDRWLVLRHDIDTDPRTAAEFWRIERTRAVASSYFFRLSTLDVELMARIGEDGGEASYHFEELATIAKARCIRRREDAVAALPEAQAMFRDNVAWLRDRTALPIHVVASHGDFVNRRLDVANRALLEDREFRDSAGIELEAYDEQLLRLLTSRHSDAPPPAGWTGEDPLAAIARNDAAVQVLVHPRNWFARRRTNAADDLLRIWEGAAYRWSWLPGARGSALRAAKGPRPQ
jgi:hypothetical protein